MSVNSKKLNNRLEDKWNFKSNIKSVPILFNVVMNKNTYEKAEKVFADLGMDNFLAFVLLIQETIQKNDLLFKLPEKETLGNDTVSFTFDMSLGDNHFKKLNRIWKKSNTTLEDWFYALYQEIARLGEFPFELPYDELSEEELAYVNSLDKPEKEQKIFRI